MFTKDQILARLRDNKEALRARGAVHAALCGSRARGDAAPGSDTDIMIDLDAEAHIGVFELVAIKRFIGNLLESPVDVVQRSALKPHVRPSAIASALDAF